MAQTHDDRDFPGVDMLALEKKAKQMVENRLSEITAGKQDEPTLGEWTHERMHVTKRPDDEHGLLRISIGGIDTAAAYCTIRGDTTRCRELVARALRALDSSG